MRNIFIIAASLLLSTTTLVFASTSEDTEEGSSYNTSLAFEFENRIMLDEEDGSSNGWYITPNGGFNFVSDIKTQGIKGKFNTGFSIGLGIGKEISKDFALQFDAGYMKNDLGTITVETTGAEVPLGGSIELKQMPLMLNAIWSNKSSLGPRMFAGFGLGTVRGELKAEGGAILNPVESEWAFAYQLHLGTMMEISPSCDFTIGYRYMDVNYDFHSVRNHSVYVGFTFGF